MWLEGEITGISQKKDFFHFLYIFCHRESPQNQVAETRQGVATRLTVSGRLQPADDQELAIKTCARQLGAALTP